MRVNGEAINGAKCWRRFSEGPTKKAEGYFQEMDGIFTPDDYRFTCGNGAVYAFCMKCPENGEFTVRALADSADQNVPEFHGIIEDVSILGFDGALTWEKDALGLHVHASGIESDLPVTLKITIA